VSELSKRIRGSTPGSEVSIGLAEAEHLLDVIRLSNRGWNLGNALLTKGRAELQGIVIVIDHQTLWELQSNPIYCRLFMAPVATSSS
jgi:hypothetical protein